MAEKELEKTKKKNYENKNEKNTVYIKVAPKYIVTKDQDVNRCHWDDGEGNDDGDAAGNCGLVFR